MTRVISRSLSSPFLLVSLFFSSHLFPFIFTLFVKIIEWGEKPRGRVYGDFNARTRSIHYVNHIHSKSLTGRKEVFPRKIKSFSILAHLVRLFPFACWWALFLTHILPTRSLRTKCLIDWNDTSTWRLWFFSLLYFDSSRFSTITLFPFGTGKSEQNDIARKCCCH